MKTENLNQKIKEASEQLWKTKSPEQCQYVITESGKIELTRQVVGIRDKWKGEKVVAIGSPV